VKTLIVYDSVYGNTEKIAQAIGEAIGGQVLQVGKVSAADLQGLALLIVGSPTRGGRPTEGLQAWLDQLPATALQGIRVATFDTRSTVKFVRIFGYAATRIADSLTQKGGALLAPPAAFFVKGTKGPLKEGELERAAAWARDLAASIK